MDWLDSEPRNTVNSKNKSRVDFVSNLQFKGMTLNNRETLMYLALSYKGGGTILRYQDIASYVGITKASAKANIKKLSELGIVKVGQQYEVGYDDKLPRRFNINLKWIG